jgi:hypothetical protein
MPATGHRLRAVHMPATGHRLRAVHMLRDLLADGIRLENKARPVPNGPHLPSASGGGGAAQPAPRRAPTASRFGFGSLRPSLWRPRTPPGTGADPASSSRIGPPADAAAAGGALSAMPEREALPCLRVDMRMPVRCRRRCRRCVSQAALRNCAPPHALRLFVRSGSRCRGTHRVEALPTMHSLFARNAKVHFLHAHASCTGLVRRIRSRLRSCARSSARMACSPSRSTAGAAAAALHSHTLQLVRTRCGCYACGHVRPLQDMRPSNAPHAYARTRVRRFQTYSFLVYFGSLVFLGLLTCASQVGRPTGLPQCLLGTHQYSRVVSLPASAGRPALPTQATAQCARCG